MTVRGSVRLTRAFRSATCRLNAAFLVSCRDSLKMNLEAQNGFQAFRGLSLVNCHLKGDSGSLDACQIEFADDVVTGSIKLLSYFREEHLPVRTVYTAPLACEGGRRTTRPVTNAQLHPGPRLRQEAVPAI